LNGHQRKNLQKKHAHEHNKELKPKQKNMKRITNMNTQRRLHEEDNKHEHTKRVTIENQKKRIITNKIIWIMNMKKIIGNMNT
jgi:hypothetical protein